MNITTDSYKLASLSETEQAIAVIQEAEATINRITGHKVTLIAYEEANNKEGK
ncbi:hypothetical protein D3C81_1755590 [compost metagenome]